MAESLGAHLVRALIRRVGDDPKREGLRDTPNRVVRSWEELFAGYGQDPVKILGTTFKKESYDEMVLVKNIEFYSWCEHHLLSFEGVAHVAYVPGDRVVGLSKIPRLVDCFARRLQIQERLTRQIAEAMQEVLKPRGVAVVIDAKHSCARLRGVKKHGSSMVTSCMLGVFKEHPETRAEFLELIK